MTESSIVLAVIQQADGKSKKRPALILRELPPYGDFLCCGISSKIHHEHIGFDDVIDPNHSDFARSGLRVKSLIRLGFLSTIAKTKIVGSMGTISKKRHRKLVKRLAKHISNKTNKKK